MTGLDDRLWRDRMADRLPWTMLFTVLIGAIEAVDLGMRLRSRVVRRRPTLTTREASSVVTGAPWLFEPTTTTGNAGNVVWLRRVGG